MIRIIASWVPNAEGRMGLGSRRGRGAGDGGVAVLGDVGSGGRGSWRPPAVLAGAEVVSMRMP